MSEHMSPQARARFNRCLHGREIMDLAAEIADDVEQAMRDVMDRAPEPRHSEALRLAILGVLVRGVGDCEWCNARRVKLVAHLDADRDQRVCAECHADTRVPTTVFPA